MSFQTTIGAFSVRGYIGFSNQTGANELLFGYTTGSGTIIDIATDNNENIVGLFDDGTDSYLFKYNSAGTNIFWILLGAATRIRGNKIAVDTSDNIYVVGKLKASPNNGAIAKYTGSGTFSWGKYFQYTQSSVVYPLQEFIGLALTNNGVEAYCTTSTDINSKVITLADDGTWLSSTIGVKIIQSPQALNVLNVRPLPSGTYGFANNAASLNDSMKYWPLSGSQTIQTPPRYYGTAQIEKTFYDGTYYYTLGYTSSTRSGYDSYTYISISKWANGTTGSSSYTLNSGFIVSNTYAAPVEIKGITSDGLGNIYVAWDNNVAKINNTGTDIVWINTLTYNGGTSLNIFDLRMNINNSVLYVTSDKFILGLPSNGDVPGSGTYSVSGYTLNYANNTGSYPYENTPLVILTSATTSTRSNTPTTTNTATITSSSTTQQISFTNFTS